MSKKRKGSKFSGCDDCGHFARHPFCPLCPKKMHWVGGITEDTEGEKKIDKTAPTRRLEHRPSIAYLLPFMVEDGQLPKEDLPRVTRQVLGPLAEKVVDSEVYGFVWAKHPYKFKVIEADLTGDGMPFVKVRYAGWSCRSHKGATPADLPGLVLERDAYRCVVCGRTAGLVVTYMKPPDEKGRATLGNMTTFCQGCQGERGDLGYWDFLRRKGIPIKELIVDFRTSYVRSIISGGRILV